MNKNFKTLLSVGAVFGLSLWTFSLGRKAGLDKASEVLKDFIIEKQSEELEELKRNRELNKLSFLFVPRENNRLFYERREKHLV